MREIFRAVVAARREAKEAFTVWTRGPNRPGLRRLLWREAIMWGRERKVGGKGMEEGDVALFCFRRREEREE